MDEVEAMRYCETRCGEQQVPFRDDIAVTRRDEVQLVLTEPSEILGCRGFPLSTGSDALPHSFRLALGVKGQLSEPSFGVILPVAEPPSVLGQVLA